MPIHDWSKVPAGLFHDFHQSWSIRIKDALNAGRLPKGVAALVEQRAGPKEPDVLAIESKRGAGWETASNGGVATIERPITRIVQRNTRSIYADRANRIVTHRALGQPLRATVRLPIQTAELPKEQLLLRGRGQNRPPRTKRIFCTRRARPSRRLALMGSRLEACPTLGEFLSAKLLDHVVGLAGG
jgi:hypothetical protein